MMVYDLNLNGKNVGIVQVEPKGLYYHISCRCDLPKNGFHRLIMDSEKGIISLGCIIPLENRFGLDTRISIKQAGKNGFTFRLEVIEQQCMVPISEDCPIPCLVRLEEACFGFRDGQSVLIFSVSSKPTGQ